MYNLDKPGSWIKPYVTRVNKQKFAQLQSAEVTQELAHGSLMEPQSQHFPQLLSLNKYPGYWRPIHVRDIFEDIKTNENSSYKCTRVLILGAMGTGKTILLHRLAKHSVLEEKIVIFLNGEFSTSRKILPSDALLSSYFANQEEISQAFLWILAYPAKVAFVIDSLDNMPFDFTEEPPRISLNEESSVSDILHNLLAGRLFCGSTVIASSRNLEVSKLHPSVQPDRYILVDCLPKSSVDALIHDFLGEKKGAEMKKRMETEYQDILPTLGHPLFLLLTAIGFKADNRFSCLADVMTNFMSLSLHSKHISDKDVRTLEALMPKCLEKIQSGTPLFTSPDLLRFTERIDCGGLVCNGYFAHYLAALHIIKMGDKEEYKEIIVNKLNKESLQLVQIMLCGVIFNKQVFEEAFDILSTEIPDVDDKRKILRDCLRESARKELRESDVSKVPRFFRILKESGDGVIDLIIQLLENRPIDFGGVKLSFSDICSIGSVISFSKSLEEMELHSSKLDGEKMQKLWEKVEPFKLQIERVGISCNVDIGASGMKYFGRFAKHCGVKCVDIGSCSLKNEHLENFHAGCDGKEFEEIIASNNRGMRRGWYFLGRLIEDGGCLDLSRCNPASDDWKDLCEGLGNKMVTKLKLDDAWKKPAYHRSLLDVIPHVKNHLDLSGWKIDANQYKELEDKWSETHKRQFPITSCPVPISGANQQKINYYVNANTANFGHMTNTSHGGHFKLHHVSDSQSEANNEQNKK